MALALALIILNAYKRLIQRTSSKLFSRFKSVKTDLTPEDTDDLGTNTRVNVIY